MNRLFSYKIKPNYAKIYQIVKNENLDFIRKTKI